MKLSSTRCHLGRTRNLQWSSDTSSQGNQVPASLNAKTRTKKMSELQPQTQRPPRNCHVVTAHQLGKFPSASLLVPVMPCRASMERPSSGPATKDQLHKDESCCRGSHAQETAKLTIRTSVHRLCSRRPPATANKANMTAFLPRTCVRLWMRGEPVLTHFFLFFFKQFYFPRATQWPNWGTDPI